MSFNHKFKKNVTYILFQVTYLQYLQHHASTLHSENIHLYNNSLIDWMIEKESLPISILAQVASVNLNTNYNLIFSKTYPFFSNYLNSTRKNFMSSNLSNEYNMDFNRPDPRGRGWHPTKARRDVLGSTSVQSVRGSGWVATAGPTPRSPVLSVTLWSTPTNR